MKKLVLTLAGIAALSAVGCTKNIETRSWEGASSSEEAADPNRGTGTETSVAEDPGTMQSGAPAAPGSADTTDGYGGSGYHGTYGTESGTGSPTTGGSSSISDSEPTPPPPPPEETR